jgi:hypothetical protein
MTVDGHPGSSNVVSAAAPLTLLYPAGTKVIELTGFKGNELRQRRRFRL